MRHLPLADPGTADHRSAARFLWWLARGQWRTLLAGMLFGVIWMACQAVMPALIGAAIDRGVATGDTRALLTITAVMLGVGLLQAGSGIMRHRFAVTNWLTAAYRTVQLVTRQATHLGATLPRRVATGEVVSIGTNDLSYLGNVMDVTARATGAVVSIVVVAILLLRSSTTLGLVVLIGVPLLLGIVGPILRPLQRRTLAHREMTGNLNNVATDIVSGLRVLRGIGGENVFHAKYSRESQAVRRAGVEVGRLQSVLDAAQVLLPGIFVVVVVWLGARFAVEGQISTGGLVAFYGYAAFLMLPLRTITEFANKFIRGFVAARRVTRVLGLAPEISDPVTPREAPGPDSEIVDVASGLVVTPGAMTAVVCDPPESAAEIADRIGWYVPGEVRWGDVPLDDIPRAIVRERIVVSDSATTLFSGRLGDGLDLHGRGDAGLRRALAAASLEDVLEALPEGLDTLVTEQGRTFSGGQRQRLTLARVLALDAEVLVLVEPTSAVDAHTEAAIASRLHELRRGHTTVVMASSPLLLDQADRVAFVRDGSVVAVGDHKTLLRTVSQYRAVVTREEDASV